MPVPAVNQHPVLCLRHRPSCPLQQSCASCCHCNTTRLVSIPVRRLGCECDHAAAVPPQSGFRTRFPVCIPGIQSGRESAFTVEHGAHCLTVSAFGLKPSWSHLSQLHRLQSAAPSQQCPIPDVHSRNHQVSGRPPGKMSRQSSHCSGSRTVWA